MSGGSSGAFRSLLLLIGLACGCDAEVPIPVAPDSRQVDAADEIHGRRLPDPYAWLEKTDTDETREWARAQTQRALAMLEPEIRKSEAMLARLSEHARQPRINTPVRRGDRFYFMIDSRSHRSPAVYVSDGRRDDLIASADDHGSIGMDEAQIVDFRASPDGSRIAIAATDPGGRRAMRVLEVASGTYDQETAEDARLGQDPWSPDGATIYYSTRAAGGPAAVWRWPLGGRPESILQAASMEIRFSVDVLHRDGELLVVSRTQGGASRAVRLSSEGRALGELELARDGRSTFIGFAEGAAFFHSVSAGEERIVRWKLRADPPATEVVLDLDGLNVNNAYLYGGRLLLEVTENGATRIRVHDMLGGHLATLDPPYGLLWTNFPVERPPVLGDAGSRHAYAGSIALDAPGVYELDLEDLRIRPWRTQGGRSDDIVIRRVAYEGADGVEIPMSIIHLDTTRPDGSAPTLVWVYGAHGFTAIPYFNAFFRTFIDAGGVLVMPQVRGGGVHGAAWHDAGSRARKRNTVSDTLEALRWLVDSGISTPGRMAIMGNSAGSVPAAAAALGRRDLVAALILEIPLTDLVRHVRWSGGWDQEFGDPDVAEEFEAILSFSPYELALRGESAPPTLILAGENDRTAPPQHAYKLTAALQRLEKSEAPVLLRVIDGAGHQIGVNEAQRTENQGLELAFLSRFIGVRLGE